MIGYKLTEQQKELLDGKQFATNQFFNPVQDLNGDWFIFNGEVENCVVEEFAWVKSLPATEYTA